MTTNYQKLVEDIKAVVADTEAVLHETAGKTSKEIAELQATMSDRLAITKEQLITAENDLLGKEKLAAEMTNEYVHGHPWKFVIIAAVIGFLFGYYF